MENQKMATKHYKSWTSQEDALLMKMAKNGSTTQEIADALGRTRSAISVRKHGLSQENELGRLSHSERVMDEITVNEEDHIAYRSSHQNNSKFELIIREAARAAKETSVSVVIRIDDIELVFNP